MQLGSGRAPGKIILFGEHAVVYGRPALAAPVTQVAAEAVVEQGPRGAGLTVWAEDLGQQVAVRDAAADDPLAAVVRLTLAHLGLAEPDWRVTVRSTIPIASGMGSGAAVSAAIVRALADAANTQYPIPNLPLSPGAVSALVYEVEKLHHGAPSGVDNTVIAYEQPVYFVRGQPPQPFTIGRPFTLAIADSGIASPTRITVEDVRQAWEREPAHFDALFDQIADVVEAARDAIAVGEPDALGPLMDENHALLREMGVSCPELDALAAAARAAGALGAKLSGGGRGGNLIALVAPETMDWVVMALRKAGALHVIVTQVGA
ncbi:MAG: mevalonate kinase [Chloroflexi bacterium HGW-Chloroflexi-1]|nr:MAG: mevalonate kinase [Chloroflexi bacterium HGW-Chloroflexi-1]